MPDREKVINELRFQLDSKEVKEQHCSVQFSVSDAEKILALLKEQEPVKPIDRWNHGFYYACGSCWEMIGIDREYPLYCPYCGKKVKWDAAN